MIGSRRSPGYRNHGQRATISDETINPVILRDKIVQLFDVYEDPGFSRSVHC